ncbi:MAG: hypothetical protein MI723_04535, partial [Caulobacterales bacterium]|nr:hypothetical protein [Caulobacterales bacterium]
RALSAKAALVEDRAEALDLARRAREHAAAATALDPQHVEGRLQLAIALWLEGRALSPIEGYLRGLPDRSRALIESTLGDSPEAPWAHALMGAWHLEVARRGGDMGAQIYGASVSAGADHCDRAMALDPDDAGIAVSCALAFLALDPAAYGEPARIALDRAAAAHADDAFEEAMKARGEALTEMLASDRADLVTAALAAWIGG